MHNDLLHNVRITAVASSLNIYLEIAPFLNLEFGLGFYSIQHVKWEIINSGVDNMSIYNEPEEETRPWSIVEAKAW